MPRSAVLVFAVSALVAATAFAYQVLVREEPVLLPEAGGADSVTVAALRDLGERLDRVEHEVFQPRLAPSDPAARLADLEARMLELERRPAAAPTRSAPETEHSATDEKEAVPPAPVDVRSLSEADLVVKARRLSGRQAYDAAAPFWREVLARGPTDELFVEAQLQLGYAHRGAKDHDKGEAAFREALRVAGPESAQGQWARYQIAWSQHYRGDHASARDTMVSVASAPSATRNTRGHALIYAARFSLELNEGDRAREALQSILRDFGGSEVPGDLWLVRHATELLGQLEK